MGSGKPKVAKHHRNSDNMDNEVQRSIRILIWNDAEDAEFILKDTTWLAFV